MFTYKVPNREKENSIKINLMYFFKKSISIPG